MKTGYKLTDGKWMTLKGTKWGEGVSHRAEKGKMEFCSPTAIHYYSDPLLADFCNPIHGQFRNPVLWEGEVKGKTKTDGLKSVCKEFTTNKRIPLPKLTIEQKVEVAIKYALKVYSKTDFVEWAEGWLSGEDRSKKSADDTYEGTYHAYNVAYHDSYDDHAAYAASCAVAAARDSRDVYAAEAARDAIYAANVIASDRVNPLEIIKEVVNEN